MTEAERIVKLRKEIDTIIANWAESSLRDLLTIVQGIMPDHLIDTATEVARYKGKV